MPASSKKSVAKHRIRQRRRGLVRMEVQVPKEDSQRLRAVSAALRDPKRAVGIREKLNALVDLEPDRPSFKELLVAGPDVELDLTRDKDAPRTTPFDE